MVKGPNSIRQYLNYNDLKQNCESFCVLKIKFVTQMLFLPFGINIITFILNKIVKEWFSEIQKVVVFQAKWVMGRGGRNRSAQANDDDDDETLLNTLEQYQPCDSL